MTDNPRNRLALAIEEMKNAQARLGDARSATMSAQAILEDAKREAEALNRADRSRRSQAVKSAVKAGKPVDAVANTSAALQAYEAAARVDAASDALAEFELEEQECAKRATDARSAVDSAVRGVIMAQASELADRIESLDAELLTMRGRLGSTSGFLTTLGPLGERLARVMNDTAASRVGLTNSVEFLRSREAQHAWRGFQSALLDDPTVELVFG